VEILKKGTRVTGADRSKLAVDLKKRYSAGESIRILAASTGRSYGFIHRILSESGVALRGRGGATRSRAARSVQVSIFLDTDDRDIADRVTQYTNELAEFLGYLSLADIESHPGSIIRRYRARVVKFLSSSALKDRATKVERALEVYTLDIKQAEVDLLAGQVVSNLIASLEDIPSACIKVGSTVLIKNTVGGQSIIKSRQLSQLEMRAWEKYPEIQNEPSKVLESLMLAVEGLRGSDSESR
jgi:Helix-turn-helix domain